MCDLNKIYGGGGGGNCVIYMIIIYNKINIYASSICIGRDDFNILVQIRSKNCYNATDRDILSEYLCRPSASVWEVLRYAQHSCSFYPTFFTKSSKNLHFSSSLEKSTVIVPAFCSRQTMNVE